MNANSTRNVVVESGGWASPRIVEGCLLMVEVSHSPALLCNRFGCRACGTI